jgi:hypothetical protein
MIIALLKVVEQLAAKQQGGANQPYAHGHHSCRFRDCDQGEARRDRRPFYVNAKVASAGAAVSPGNDDPGVYVPVMSTTSHLPSRAVWSRQLQQSIRPPLRAGYVNQKLRFEPQ